MKLVARSLSRHGQYERVGTDFANSDSFVEVELDDGHLVAGALLAEQSATVTAACVCACVDA